MPEPEIPKLYYSIGEVSEMTALDAHVLRYWETEFRELSPRKNRGGKRLYRDSDIKLLLQIKDLLYERRFTIEGARKSLKELGEVEPKKNEAPTQSGISSEKLGEIKRGLIELRLMIENGERGAESEE